MLKLVVPFIRGPLHGIKFEMEWIPPLNVCFDSRDRAVHCYVRDEMAYFYDPDLSEKMTAIYDVVRQKFPGKRNDIKPVE